MTWGEANFGRYSIRRERLKWRIYVFDSDDVTRPVFYFGFWRWITAARVAQALSLARSAGAAAVEAETDDPMFREVEEG